VLLNLATGYQVLSHLQACDKSPKDGSPSAKILMSVVLPAPFGPKRANPLQFLSLSLSTLKNSRNFSLDF